MIVNRNINYYSKIFKIILNITALLVGFMLIFFIFPQKFNALSYCSSSGGCSYSAEGIMCVTYPARWPACNTACSSSVTSTCTSSGVWTPTPLGYNSCYFTPCPTPGPTYDAVYCGCYEDPYGEGYYGTLSSCQSANIRSCTSAACGTKSCGSYCTTYSSSSVACGGSCTPITSRCNNQTWSVTPGGFSSCTVAACTYTISGTVFIDTDGDGIKDAGETTGYNGATVNVGGSNVTTNASGAYSRGTLSAGSYTVTLTVPSGYIVTTLKTVSSTVGPDDVINFGIRSGCSFPGSGSYTLALDCNLGAAAGAIDGVDAGTGVTNTADLTINNGVTLTIGSGNNQTLVFGHQITNYGTIIIAKGVGVNASIKKGPIWVLDTDGDRYSSPNVTMNSLTQSTKPANYIRRSASLGIDCSVSNVNIYPGAGCP